MNDRYLIQWADEDGVWHTCATRSSFATAKAKARAEYRAMKGAHMTAIIRDGNPPIFRRTFENNFDLA